MVKVMKRGLESVLKWEEDGKYSRDEVSEKAGSDLLVGSVVEVDGNDVKAYDSSADDACGFMAASEVLVAREALIDQKSLVFEIPFDSGGTTEIVEADALVIGVGADKATAAKITVTSGTWAGGDAAGVIHVYDLVGDLADGDAIKVGGVDCGTVDLIAGVLVVQAIAKLKGLGIIARVGA